MACLSKRRDQFLRQLRSQQLDSIIICPSNPFLSIEPVLRLPGVRDAMIANKAPVIAISPIVAGMALKGPAAKMMQELGMPATALAVAEFYGDLVDGMVIDDADAGLAGSIEALGIEVLVCPTVMKTLQDRIVLAETALNFANKLMHTLNPEGSH